jgi:hypothetical protein
MKKRFYIKPSWKWGTPEGSREFDRLLDRSLTFREKLEWLEEAETLALRLRANRESKMKAQGGK